MSNDLQIVPSGTRWFWVKSIPRYTARRIENKYILTQTLVHTNTHKQMLIAIEDKKLEESKCPSIDKWINKMWYYQPTKELLIHKK